MIMHAKTLPKGDVAFRVTFCMKTHSKQRRFINLKRTPCHKARSQKRRKKFGNKCLGLNKIAVAVCAVCVCSSQHRTLITGGRALHTMRQDSLTDNCRFRQRVSSNWHRESASAALTE